MRALCVLLLTALSSEADERLGMPIRKCCGAFEMLSGDGRSCVNAPWDRNVTLETPLWEKRTDVFSPSDPRWMGQWLPPGLPMHRVWRVRVQYLNFLHDYSENPEVRSVEASAAWNGVQAVAEGAAYFRKRVVFDDNGYVLRRDTTSLFTRLRRGRHIYYWNKASFIYCVDAARPPLAPFALLVEPDCSIEDCVAKCCIPGQVLTKGDEWTCVGDARGFWSPANSSFAHLFRPETPFVRWSWMNLELRPCRTPVRLALWDPRVPPPPVRGVQHFFFSSWDTCVDFERHEDGHLTETLLYCEFSRVARGVYMLLQPLCFVSASLLLVALLSVACDSGMRRKAHGWCLACHAACLLGFNLGQAGYLMSISYEIDATPVVPFYLNTVCSKTALGMYFLLMAANCWLTALCFNMAWGFRKLQVARPGGGLGRDLKRFLALSAFAWGLPTAMTGLCAYAFEEDADLRKWFSPSLAETRTCFRELILLPGVIRSYQPGTALFYYGPVGVLVIVNFICISYTLRRVQFLRRGNSVLQREEDRLTRGQRHPKGDNPNTASSGAARTTLVDAKTIKMYVKIILTAGVVEVISETISWILSYHTYSLSYKFYRLLPDRDHGLAHRATGYAADCFRAACVVWLATPEGGYLGALRRWLGGGRGNGAGRPRR